MTSYLRRYNSVTHNVSSIGGYDSRYIVARWRDLWPLTFDLWPLAYFFQVSDSCDLHLRSLAYTPWPLISFPNLCDTRYVLYTKWETLYMKWEICIWYEKCPDHWTLSYIWGRYPTRRGLWCVFQTFVPSHKFWIRNEKSIYDMRNFVYEIKNLYMFEKLCIWFSMMMMSYKGSSIAHYIDRLLLVKHFNLELGYLAASRLAPVAGGEHTCCTLWSAHVVQTASIYILWLNPQVSWSSSAAPSNMMVAWEYLNYTNYLGTVDSGQCCDNSSLSAPHCPTDMCDTMFEHCATTAPQWVDDQAAPIATKHEPCLCVGVSVHVFLSIQKSQLQKLLAPGVIWGQPKTCRSPVFDCFTFTDSSGIFRVFLLIQIPKLCVTHPSNIKAN